MSSIGMSRAGFWAMVAVPPPYPYPLNMAYDTSKGYIHCFAQLITVGFKPMVNNSTMLGLVLKLFGLINHLILYELRLC